MEQVCVIGDSVADLVFELPTKFLHRLTGSGAISFPFGSKLAVNGYQLCSGGSGANVAVGLGRLGATVTLLTGISEDHFGVYLATALEKESLSLKAKRFTEPSALSVILRVSAERTILTAHPANYFYLREPIPEEGWLHIGPLPENEGAFYQRLIAHLVKTRQKYSLNPSLETIESRDRYYQTLLRSAAVLFVNLEEGRLLARLPVNSEIKDIMTALHRLGAKVICLTAGEKGAYVSDQITLYYARALADTHTRVDATGAGDAFASGFLASFVGSSLTDADRLGDALKYAILNSAAVVGAVGGQKGLLDRTALVRDLKAVTLKVLV